MWTVLAWCAGLVFTFLIRVRLPGEDAPPVLAGVLFYRWDGITQLVLATALTVAGARWLDRSPLGGLGLLLGASVIATMPLSVGEIPLAQFLAVDVALYTVAASRPRRTGAVAVALALGVLAGYLAFRWLAGWTTGTSAELAVALTAVVAWLTGDSAHRSRLHSEELRARSTAQAVSDERLRIARELHDMVAHSIGIVALQAGAARRVIDTQPERAREALGEVEATSRETLAGLRRMLGALREADRGGDPAREGPPVRRGSTRWTGWRRRPPRRGCGWRCAGWADGGRCRGRSTCRRTASCRSRSPMWSATPRPARAG
ncbi:sensor histidine kinase [Streptomyces zhihengii]